MNKITTVANIKTAIGVLIILAVVVAVVAVVKLDVLGNKGGGLSKEFKYDVNELVQIDPNLILYEESAEAIKTGLANTHGITVDSKGSIYVAGDKAIRIFDQSGEQLGEIKLNDTPRCLAVTENGTIYAGQRDHVEVYDAEGQKQASWESVGQDAILTSIVTSDNNVFVADAGNNRVQYFTARGSYLGEWGGYGGAEGEFHLPSDVALSRDGFRAYVADTGNGRIQYFRWRKPPVEATTLGRVKALFR